MDLIENRTVDEIAVGDRAEIERVLTHPDIAMFATVSADVNPASLEEGEEEGPELTQGIVHGMWAGTMISAVLATRLPGPGTVHLGQIVPSMSATASQCVSKSPASTRVRRTSRSIAAA